MLGWVVADIAYRTRSELPEGKLTDLRKAVVNAAALAEVARELDLGDQILLGKGEAAAGGRRKPSILADALEAVIGAVYLDAGADTAHRLVARLFAPRLDAAIDGLAGLDHKTTLQELAARRLDAVPSYEVEQEGPDHAKTFRARVRLQGVVWGVGEGRSKKRAEQAAAKEACRRLLDEEPVGLG